MKRTVALLATLLLTTALPAAAQVRLDLGLGLGLRLAADEQGEARQGVQTGRMVPLSAVIEQIRRRTPGRPLDAGSEYMGDRPVYRVRWLTSDGRRIDYLIDAATGAILSGG